MDDDWINPTEKFSVTTTYITLKNQHIWGYPVYVLYARLKGNIDGITKWKPHSRSLIYLGNSPFYSGSVDQVLNPEAGYFSYQFHVVFDD